MKIRLREVKTEKFSRSEGKTPAFDTDQVQKVLDKIDTSNEVGLRDRALLGTLAYTFARIGAVVNLKVEDYFQTGKRSDAAGAAYGIIGYSSPADDVSGKNQSIWDGVYFGGIGEFGTKVGPVTASAGVEELYTLGKGETGAQGLQWPKVFGDINVGQEGVGGFGVMAPLDSIKSYQEKGEFDA